MILKIQLHVQVAEAAAEALFRPSEKYADLRNALLDAATLARKDPHGVGLISIAVIDAPFDI